MTAVGGGSSSRLLILAAWLTHTKGSLSCRALIRPGLALEASRCRWVSCLCSSSHADSFASRVLQLSSRADSSQSYAMDPFEVLVLLLSC